MNIFKKKLRFSDKLTIRKAYDKKVSLLILNALKDDIDTSVRYCQDSTVFINSLKYNFRIYVCSYFIAVETLEGNSINLHPEFLEPVGSNHLDIDEEVYKEYDKFISTKFVGTFDWYAGGNNYTPNGEEFIETLPDYLLYR